MNNSELDISVLLIFFNRPEQLYKTFEQIRRAKPSKLFLYQDGARESNLLDVEKVNECRKIVDNVDWKCEVYKYYQDKNVGCDPSEYIAQKWAFSIVDKCIVLEDDDVASLSFFKFCKEMLDKYENDERICRISGLNHLEKYNEKNSSYFFTTSGSIWGWASWKRVIDKWDSTYSFLDNKNALKEIKKVCKKNKVDYNSFIKTCVTHKKSGREHYESIFFAYRLLTNSLTIVPSVNLISNIGLTDDSTHATGNIKKLPKGIRRVFAMKTYELSFPLTHPMKVENDLLYVKEVNEIMGYSLMKKIWRRIESKVRSIIYR